MNFYYLAAVLIWLLFCLGYLKRRNVRFHIRAMSGAIAADFLLVFIIEFNNQAVEKVLTKSFNF
ncbi:MAG: hypothetical protein D6780_05525, partial [Candidatus Dadabacteria bacterium]